MANLTRTTRDHEEIRRWAEERGGKPSHVKRTGSAEDTGILRIDFPGYTGEDTLEPIGWDEWFQKFDDRKLALIYQEETAGGARSNFNKIVSAETATEAEAKSHQRRGAGSARSRAGASSAKKSAQSGTSATTGGTKKTSGRGKKTAAAAKKAGSRTSGRSGRSTKKAAKTTTKRPARKPAKKSPARSKSASAKKSAGKRSTKTATKKSSAKKRR